MNKILLIFSLVFSTNILAKKYYELKTIKDKTVYYNTLLVRDSVSENPIKEKKLVNTHKEAGILVQNTQSPYLFFYAKLKKNKQAQIQVIERGSLSILHTINVEHINFTKFRESSHYYIEITPDMQHLIIYVGKKAKQKLLLIDGKTGNIDKEILLSKKAKIIKRSIDGKYFWTRFAKDSKKNLIEVYDSQSLEKIKSITTKSKFLLIENYNHLFFIIKQTKIHSAFSKAEYIISVLNLKNKVYYKDFITSQPPIIFSKSNGIIYMTGRSIKEPKHLKLVKFMNNKLFNLENKDFDIDAYSLQQIDETESFILFGKTSIGLFDANNPETNKKSYIPFKIDGGIANSDYSKIYFISHSTLKVGIVDTKQNKTIAIEPIGSQANKLGLAFFNAAVFTAVLGVNLGNSGWIIIPGTRISKSSLMLNYDESLLFAINSRTNDVTVMNANDLSNKKVYSTGRGTAKIIQAGTKGSPVVVISQKRVSFFDAKSGNYLGRVKYDDL